MGKSGQEHVQRNSSGGQESETKNSNFFIGDMQDIEDVPAVQRKKRISLSNWYQGEGDEQDTEKDSVSKWSLLTPPNTPAKEKIDNQMSSSPLQCTLEGKEELKTWFSSP